MHAQARVVDQVGHEGQQLGEALVLVVDEAGEPARLVSDGGPEQELVEQKPDLPGDVLFRTDGARFRADRSGSDLAGRDLAQQTGHLMLELVLDQVFGHVAIGTRPQAPEPVLPGQLGGRHQDDGDPQRQPLLLEKAAQLVAADVGHHDIRNDEIRHLPEGHGDALDAIDGFEDPIAFFLQQLADDLPVNGRIVDHQDLGCAAIRCFG